MAEGVKKEKKKRELPKDFVRKRPDEILSEIDTVLAEYEEHKAQS